MPWMVALAPLALNLIGGISNKRSSSREVPGMAEYISQSLAGQRNAQMFAEAAVNPNSEWFRNLAGLFREGDEEAAVRGLRLQDFNERRAIGRGGANVIGERRDEARIGALMDAFQRAKISSRSSAHTALLGASRGEAATMGDPSKAFGILQQFGQANADRTKGIFDSLGQIIQKIPWGSGGGLSGYLDSNYQGIPVSSPLYNPNYGGLY